MTDDEIKIVKAIKRQAHILSLDLKQRPERYTAAQRAESIIVLTQTLLGDKDD